MTFKGEMAMNLDHDKQVDLEKEKIKIKIWIYFFIIIVSVCCVFWFMYSIYSSFKALSDDLSANTFYVLELIDDNREEILSILEKENRDYCESIYKIEYKALFPNDYSATIYCVNEDNINFGISDREHSKLIKYIYDNGITEKRKES